MMKLKMVEIITPINAVKSIINTKAKVISMITMEKTKAIRAINTAKVLATIEVPQIAIVTPAIMNKTIAIIFLPRK